MPERKLTKREYLGEGYVHVFVNDITGETVVVPTTKEQYESMGGVGGSANNPVLEGHTWKYSSGGTYKVDTPSTLLGKDEYCIVPAKPYETKAGISEVILVNFREEDGSSYHTRLPKESIDASDMLNVAVVEETKIVKE